MLRKQRHEFLGKLCIVYKLRVILRYLIQTNTQFNSASEWDMVQVKVAGSKVIKVLQ